MADLPRRMRNLKTYMGYPVTFVTFVGPDGRADFKVIDERKKMICLRNRLCGMCGQKLGDTIALIGGEKSVKSGFFTDPPMHSECARYAARTCPYLCRPDRNYSKAPPKHAALGEVIVRDYELVDEGIPKRLAIYYTKTYDPCQIKNHGPLLYVKAGPATSIDWTIMPATNLDPPEDRSPNKPEPEDAFDQIVKSLKNNEGVIIFDQLGDQYKICKITREDLERLDTMSFFNVVCPVDRGIAGDYSQHLEHKYFPPGTRSNDLLQVMFFRWQDMLWSIVTVPLGLKETCFKAATEVKMRLSDGIPHVLSSGDHLHDKTPLASLPIELGIPMAASGVGFATFPLKSENTFGLEPLYDTPGPKVSVMVSNK
jgi:hypothetical protein